MYLVCRHILPGYQSNGWRQIHHHLSIDRNDQAMARKFPLTLSLKKSTLLSPHTHRPACDCAIKSIPRPVNKTSVNTNCKSSTNPIQSSQSIDRQEFNFGEGFRCMSWQASPIRGHFAHLSRFRFRAFVLFRLAGGACQLLLGGFLVKLDGEEGRSLWSIQLSRMGGFIYNIER